MFELLEFFFFARFYGSAWWFWSVQFSTVGVVVGDLIYQTQAKKVAVNAGGEELASRIVLGQESAAKLQVTKVTKRKARQHLIVVTRWQSQDVGQAGKTCWWQCEVQVAKDIDQHDAVLLLTPMAALADSSWKCLSEDRGGRNILVPHVHILSWFCVPRTLVDQGPQGKSGNCGGKNQDNLLLKQRNVL